MSLDVNISAVRLMTVFDANITHNLGGMAKEAGIYKHLWRPEELGITNAGDLVEPLTNGLALMRGDPIRFKAFDAENGWGIYEDFIPWIEKYLQACIDNPDGIIEVYR